MEVCLRAELHRCLKPICILVPVDEDVIEARCQIASNFSFLHHLRSVEQKVVIVEHVLPLLGLNVAAKEFFQFAFPTGAPRKVSP